MQDFRDAEEALRRLNQELESRVEECRRELERAHRRSSILAAQQRLANVGSWELEVASGRVSWSEKLFGVFGLEQEDTPPDETLQRLLFAPESWVRLRAAMQHAIGTGESYDLRLTAVRENGELRSLVARCEALRGESGNVEHLVGTFEDVTAAEPAEQAVRRLSTRLMLATSAAKIGVWEWNLATGELVWDEVMHELYQSPGLRESLNYMDWRAMIHPEDLARVERELSAALESTRPFDTSFRVFRSDGVRHMRARASLYRDDSGRALTMIGVNWDITEQRVADLALRKSEALQRAFLAQAGSAIIAIDRDGTITLFNPAAEELLGYSAAEVVGVATPLLFHDAQELAAKGELLKNDGASVTSPFEVFAYLTRHGGADVGEWTFVRKDGARVPVLLAVTAYFHEDGALAGYMAVAVSLVKRKREEQRLIELNRLLAERTEEAEAASRAKSRFLANMSHEIRTPLGAITGLTYLLRRTPLSGEQRALLAKVEGASRSLLSMINDILDLSKIEAQQLTLERSPFSLTRLMDDLNSIMTGFSVGRSLELSVDVAMELPDMLLGDGMRLMQILTNMTANAVKFTEEGRVGVTLMPVSVSAQSVRIRCEVRDTGCGLDETEASMVFERFTRIERPSGHHVGGTGLGLAIVRELAELMGGEVGVNSIPGVGSTFWCELPFERADGLAQFAGRPFEGAPRAATAETGRLDGLRVLAVDDSAVNQEIVQGVLSLHGAEVTLEMSGRSAVERIARSPTSFDVVLMDMQMPEMDGVAAVRCIRERHPDLALPIIALTAGALASERERALAAGMTDFISKPYEPDALVSHLRRYLPRALSAGDARNSELRAGGADESLPPMDGIDAKEAEARVGRGLSRFRRIATTLIRDLEALHRRLETASEPRSEAVRTEVHKLKGSSGNIGAKDLHRALASFERAVTEDTPLDETKALVLHELERLEASLRCFLAAPESKGPPAESAPPQWTIAQLCALLREQNLNALKVLDALTPSLTKTLGVERVERLHGLANTLDFRAALLLLDESVRDQS